MPPRPLPAVLPYSRTPLHYAAFHGQRSTLEALLDSGAGVRMADNDGVTALHWACSGGYKDVIGVRPIKNKKKTGWQRSAVVLCSCCARAVHVNCCMPFAWPIQWHTGQALPLDKHRFTFLVTRALF